MQDIYSYCQDHNIRLTEPRLYVYQIIQQAGRPIGAYDILEKLGAHLSNPKPPTAYRAIDFLIEHGFIHRIESLNAYIICGSDHRHKGSQFMICDSCGQAEETHVCTLPEEFQDKALSHKFTSFYWNLEMHGCCAACSGQA